MWAEWSVFQKVRKISYHFPKKEFLKIAKRFAENPNMFQENKAAFFTFPVYGVSQFP